MSPKNYKKVEASQGNANVKDTEVKKPPPPPCPPNILKPGDTTNVIIPTKYKNERTDGRCEKTIPIWLMPTGLIDEIKPPALYPPNRRKPGVTLPIGGRLPYKIMLNDECPDIEKEAVSSLKEVMPIGKGKKGKGSKRKKGKRK